MKTNLTRIGIIVALISIASFVPSVLAVEGGLGRPISGAAVNPYAGLVPPAPGFAVSIGETYYEGSIGGSTSVPVNNLLTLGIDMKVSFNP